MARGGISSQDPGGTHCCAPPGRFPAFPRKAGRGDRIALTYKDGVVLRDIAMKYESGEPLTREDGIALMQFAQKARPHGQIIAGKLKEWRGQE